MSYSLAEDNAYEKSKLNILKKADGAFVTRRLFLFDIRRNYPYYLYMIKFDGEPITWLLRRKKNALNISYVVFAVLIVSAVAAATLARGAFQSGSNPNLYFAALSIAVIFLVGFICVIVFWVTPAERKLKYAVCKEIAEGLLAHEALLKGGDVIGFSADYEGDVLTLSRKNFTGEIKIDPSRITSVDGLGGAGAKIGLDLKPLKAVPSLYATAGTKLWQFLQAYYSLHGKDNGVKSVTVTDNMGKTPLTLPVFSGDAPVKSAAKNYFLKKGLVK